MDPAPDPAVFVLDLQDDNKKLFFLLITFWRYFKLFLESFDPIRENLRFSYKNELLRTSNSTL